MTSKTTQIQVRGYHLDGYRHVNHARYLEFLEDARWQMFDNSNIVADFAAKNWGFAVVNINIDYRYPATEGDVLEIQSTVGELTRKTITIRQIIQLKNTAKIVVRASVTFVILDLLQQCAITLDESLKNTLIQALSS
ncbi:MAG: acyl-CoA thioesterase [Neisseriaceae bacterium]|nr:acyl-CoA thioesterase [Neisseriaceae bacterium]